jgi:hypothetical protein
LLFFSSSRCLPFVFIFLFKLRLPIDMLRTSKPLTARFVPVFCGLNSLESRKKQDGNAQGVAICQQVIGLIEREVAKEGLEGEEETASL